MGDALHAAHSSQATLSFSQGKPMVPEVRLLDDPRDLPMPRSLDTLLFTCTMEYPRAGTRQPCTVVVSRGGPHLGWYALIDGGGRLGELYRTCWFQVQAWLVDRQACNIQVVH